MPPLVQIKMQLNTPDLQVSLRQLQQKTGKLPSYLVNRAVFSIADKVVKTMPKVDPGTIDADLDVVKVTPSGKIPKATNPKNSRILGFREPTVGGGFNVSYAWMIVLARMYPAGTTKTGDFKGKMNYMKWTGGLRPLSKPDTHGSAAFWQWVSEHAERMVKARHSSTGFFRMTAQVIRMIFSEAIQKNSSRLLSVLSQASAEALPGGDKLSSKIGTLAGARAAAGNQLTARATFWVATSEADTKGEKKGAIFRIAQPIWQAAVDAEAASIRQYATEEYKQAARESGFLVH